MTSKRKVYCGETAMQTILFQSNDELIPHRYGNNQHVGWAFIAGHPGDLRRRDGDADGSGFSRIFHRRQNHL